MQHLIDHNHFLIARQAIFTDFPDFANPGR
jgi:hypothetical protein